MHYVLLSALYFYLGNTIYCLFSICLIPNLCSDFCNPSAIKQPIRHLILLIALTYIV